MATATCRCPDRWRILDALSGTPKHWLDPYNTNTLKADKPVFGDDWFVNVNAVADTLYEPSRVPTGIGAQYTARPGENNTFGRYGRTLVTETDILSLSLIKGNTAYKPPEIELRVTPVFNYNSHPRSARSGRSTSTRPKARCATICFSDCRKGLSTTASGRF